MSTEKEIVLTLQPLTKGHYMTIYTPDALLDSTFVTRGESAIVLGNRSRTHQLCVKIIEKCKGQGKTVQVLCTDATVADTRLSSSDLLCDLLFVWQLPQNEPVASVGDTQWTAGQALSSVLMRRSENNKSTLIASDDRPINWVLFNMLGRHTFWSAAQLKIGLLLNQHDPAHSPLFESVQVPDNIVERRFFQRHSVAPMSWHNQNDRLCKELNLDAKPDVPDWHWVDVELFSAN